ncbi:hypothetical protein BLNAU_6842 [Blattamonas nauphoetae]|uniref:Uncharacterized protein n=1 Tax=Blattamonas nauphoetae TaxID=2049346 RepID=A0ABQ9Y316_9EUKA|nr:hypothetical protein BLNAU_6842 [Blattamonas nauphoetae]
MTDKNSGRRNSVSLFVPLDDDTLTDHPLSPHSFPKPPPAALEKRTRLPLADVSRRGTSEHNGVQTDKQNTNTVGLASCHIVSAVTTNLAECT